MKQEKQEKKQKIEYLGAGFFRTKCDCGSMVNLLFNQNEITQCTHCKKESRIEMYQIEVTPGTKVKKFVEKESSKKIEVPKMATADDMAKIKIETDKIKESIRTVNAKEEFVQ